MLLEFKSHTSKIIYLGSKKAFVVAPMPGSENNTHKRPANTERGSYRTRGLGSSEVCSLGEQGWGDIPSTTQQPLWASEAGT